MISAHQESINLSLKVKRIICLTSKLFNCWSDQYKNGKLITQKSCRGIQKKINILVKNDFKKLLNGTTI